MKNHEKLGCEHCRKDPVSVALACGSGERVSASVEIFRCPKCQTKILDDIYGWKGSGITFLATDEMIEEYLRGDQAKVLSRISEMMREQ